MATMATSSSEVEDLAALVGIEILPDDANDAISTEIDDGPQDKRKDTAVTLPAESEAGEAEEGEVEEEVSEDSAQRLSSLQEEFAARYSQSDAEFAHTLATPTHSPPCVSPWWSNNRGGGDRGRGGRGQGWGRGHPDRRDYRGRGDYHHSSHGYRDNQHQGHRQDNWGRRDHYRDRDRSGHRDRSPVHRERY